MKWRQGRKVPNHVYEQRGPEPSDAPQPHGDRPVATFFSEKDAQMACFAIEIVTKIARNVNGPSDQVLRLTDESVAVLRTLAQLELKSLRGRTVHDHMMVEVGAKQIAALEDFLLRTQPLALPADSAPAAQVP